MEPIGFLSFGRNSGLPPPRPDGGSFETVKIWTDFEIQTFSKSRVEHIHCHSRALCPMTSKPKQVDDGPLAPYSRGQIPPCLWKRQPNGDAQLDVNMAVWVNWGGKPYEAKVRHPDQPFHKSPSWSKDGPIMISLCTYSNACPFADQGNSRRWTSSRVLCSFLGMECQIRPVGACHGHPRE